MSIPADGIRIDPCDQQGIHLVQKMGGEYIYIKFSYIKRLIDDLEIVLKDKIGGE